MGWQRIVQFHASWLNQIEIYFSIIQRKVLTPNTFEWKLTRRDLQRMLNRIDQTDSLSVPSLESTLYIIELSDWST